MPKNTYQTVEKPFFSQISLSEVTSQFPANRNACSWQLTMFWYSWQHLQCFDIHGNIYNVLIFMATFTMFLYSWQHSQWLDIHGNIYNVLIFMATFKMFWYSWQHLQCFDIHCNIYRVLIFVEISKFRCVKIHRQKQEWLANFKNRKLRLGKKIRKIGTLGWMETLPTLAPPSSYSPSPPPSLAQPTRRSLYSPVSPEPPPSSASAAPRIHWAPCSANRARRSRGASGSDETTVGSLASNSCDSKPEISRHRICWRNNNNNKIKHFDSAIFTVGVMLLYMPNVCRNSLQLLNHSPALPHE